MANFETFSPASGSLLPTFQSQLFSGLQEKGGYRHAFFTRQGGLSAGPYESLNVSFSKQDNRSNVVTNWERISAHFGLPATILAYPSLVHSNLVLPVKAPFEPRGPGTDDKARPRVDGVMTSERGILLAVASADCVPILFYGESKTNQIGDSDKSDSAGGKPVVGAVHAGWKGALAGIVQNAVTLMRDHFAVPTEHVYATLGPCIRAQSYEVTDEFRTQFLSETPANEKYFSPPVADRPGHCHFDLPAYVYGKLLAAGVPENQIDDIKVDTVTNPDKLFSYRRVCLEGQSAFGNQAACIVIL